MAILGMNRRNALIQRYNSPRAIKTVIHGLNGEVTVNGSKFNSVMPALALNDVRMVKVVWPDCNES